jgi:hypothetical protein
VADVYSQRLFEVHGLAGGATLTFTVPSGYTAIVRDIDLYSSPTLSNAEIYISGSSGQTFFYASVAATTKDSPQWRGRQVLYAGETMTIYNGASESWDVTISGYLLANP